MNILNMVYTLRFLPLQNAVCFIILTFGSCIIHILYTGCAKIWKNNSGAKRLTQYSARLRIPQSLVWLCIRSVGSCGLLILQQWMFCAAVSERVIYINYCRVLLQLVVGYLFKKWTAFYDARSFFPVFTRARHWVTRIQCAQSVAISRTFQYFFPSVHMPSKRFRVRDTLLFCVSIV